MSYIIEHTKLGFCWWDLLAFIILIVVIAVFLVKRHDMKKEEKDLEDQLSEMYTNNTVAMDGES